MSNVSRKLVNFFTNPLAIAALALAGYAGPLTTATAEEWVGQEVRVEYAVDGDLKINADGKKVRQQPVKIRAKLQFQQAVPSSPPRTTSSASKDSDTTKDSNASSRRALDSDTNTADTNTADTNTADTNTADANTADADANSNAKPSQPEHLLRQYLSATADLHIGENKFRNRLEAAPRTVLVGKRNGKLLLNGVDQPLKVYELDLLTLPADPASLGSLLPIGEVSKRTAWKVEKDVLAPFLRLDAIIASTCSGRVVALDDEVMTVEIKGEVNGVIQGAGTDVKLVATMVAGLKSRQVESVTLEYSEDRAISHAEPGFKIKAKLIATIAAAPLPAELSAGAIKAAVQAVGIEPLVEFRSTAAGLRVLLDPRWKVMVNRQNLVVLRFVDKGDLIAQCNITPLPKLPAGTDVDPASLESQFKKSLAGKAVSIAEAAASETAQGLTQLRLSASGEEGELKVHWIYHLLYDANGNRAAAAFTLREDYLSRFASADESLVQTLELIPRASKPAEAKQAEKPGNTSR